jgi:hypothetical protein
MVWRDIKLLPGTAHISDNFSCSFDTAGFSSWCSFPPLICASLSLKHYFNSRLGNSKHPAEQKPCWQRMEHCTVCSHYIALYQANYCTYKRQETRISVNRAINSISRMSKSHRSSSIQILAASILIKTSSSHGCPCQWRRTPAAQFQEHAPPLP